MLRYVQNVANLKIHHATASTDDDSRGVACLEPRSTSSSVQGVQLDSLVCTD